jgi:hypothetical protein
MMLKKFLKNPLKKKQQFPSLDTLKKEVVRKDAPRPAQAGELELKVVKAINDIEALKARLEENSKAIIIEINRTNARVESSIDLMKAIPRQTVAELKDIKNNQPIAYDKIKDVISMSLKATVLDSIDTKILGLIKENEKINSRQLLEKAQTQDVCSKNTLFVHLKKLEDRGLISKKRAGHEVMYALNVQQAKPETSPLPSPQIAAAVIA